MANELNFNGVLIDEFEFNAQALDEAYMNGELIFQRVTNVMVAGITFVDPLLSGYFLNNGMGSLSPAINPVNGSTIISFMQQTFQANIEFRLSGIHANSDSSFSSIKISSDDLEFDGLVLNRSAATYSTAGGNSFWLFSGFSTRFIAGETYNLVIS